jgi:hypothetical protein
MMYTFSLHDVLQGGISSTPQSSTPPLSDCDLQPSNDAAIACTLAVLVSHPPRVCDSTISDRLTAPGTNAAVAKRALATRCTAHHQRPRERLCFPCLR